MAATRCRQKRVGKWILPSVYQGVQCRSEGDPVLFLNDPDGMSRDLRKASIDAINQVNAEEVQKYNDQKFYRAFRNTKWPIRYRISVPE